MCITFLKKRKATLGDILERIEQADDREISEIAQAAMRRYEKVFPDWEVGLLSLHKDPALRQKEIEEIMEFLKKYPLK